MIWRASRYSSSSRTQALALTSITRIFRLTGKICASSTLTVRRLPMRSKSGTTRPANRSSGFEFRRSIKDPIPTLSGCTMTMEELLPARIRPSSGHPTIEPSIILMRTRRQQERFSTPRPMDSTAPTRAPRTWPVLSAMLRTSIVSPISTSIWAQIAPS